MEEDLFFHAPAPATDGAKPAKGARHPAAAGAATGPRERRRGRPGAWLPKLACAFLLALLAAGWVWVVLPLRLQLGAAEQAANQAMAALAELQARVKAAAPPVAAPAAAPANDGRVHAATEEDQAWAQAVQARLEAALPKDPASPPTLQRQGASVLMHLPTGALFAGRDSSLGAHGQAFFVGALTAVQAALAADESPYALAIVVPLPQGREGGDDLSSAAGASQAGHQADRRRRRRRHPAARRTDTPSPAAVAAARAQALWGPLDKTLALRPHSQLSVGFGTGEAAAAEPTEVVILRLQRRAP